jgi:hypothetical protein
MNKILTLSLFVFSSFFVLQAQQITMPTSKMEAVCVSGGNAIGAGGAVSYTAGQVLCASLSGNNGSAFQGIQQPYEVFIETGISPPSTLDSWCTVFPNPVANCLVVQIGRNENANFSYQLLNMEARILRSGNLVGEKSEIDMAYLQPATYFLKVLKQGEEVLTFKIIKNQ